MTASAEQTGTTEATVLTRDDGPVRVVTLNRPASRNAISLELRVVLGDLLEDAMADPSVGAIVLTGAGGTFCSGGDISSMERQGVQASRERVEAVQRVIRVIWSGPKPVIAAVEGFAIGAGAGLAMACDRVVAATSATFGMSFTGVGLAGDMGIFASLPARAGVAAARQLMLLPQRIGAAEALQLGVADSLADPGRALDSALADARAIAAGPPLAIAGIRQMLGAWPSDPFAVLDREVDLAGELMETDDYAEGVAAFLAKRKPQFRGR